MTKKTEVRVGLYMVTPTRKPGTVWPSSAKDALPGDSQYCNYVRKDMEIQAPNTNARVQAEIDYITRQMIAVGQQLLAAENAS